MSKRRPVTGAALDSDLNDALEKPSLRSASLPTRQRPVDQRAAWLLRAAARYHLVREGAMSLDEAFDEQFVCDLLDATSACPCHSQINQNFDRIARELREERWRKR